MVTDIKWTAREALDATKRALADSPGRSDADPTLPVFQWAALHTLEACQEAYQAGNEFELMHAIRVCANHDLPLPEWTARAFIKGYDTIANAREKSWDKVFGAPYPKGAHLHATRKKRVLKFAVWNRVQEIRAREPEVPIDESLFASVGHEFNIGKTRAAEFYYEAEKLLSKMTSAKS